MILKIIRKTSKIRSIDAFLERNELYMNSNSKLDFEEIIKIGHRGSRVGVDENTESAFETVVKLNMDYIECDIRMTKDKKLVILHDDTLARTFKIDKNQKLIQKISLKRKIRQKISELDYEECLIFSSKKFECKLPLISNILDKYIKKIGFMLEIKDPLVIPALIEITKRLKAEFREKIVFSSNRLNDMQKIIEIYPHAKLCFNITNSKDFKLNDFLFGNISSKEDMPIKFDMISLSTQKITANFVNKCIKFNIKPLCWNFISEKNPLKKTKQMIQLGVKGILFDHPEIVKNLHLIKKHEISN
ncbi:MAG: glycerophosphodiester phosphodiesterase [Promethearchaeota archaeon]